MFQSALFTFNQQNNNTRFNHDFMLALNEAQQEFANSRKWGCLRKANTATTVADTETVSLWIDFGSFYNVRGAHRITSPAANANTAIEIINPDQQYAREYTGTDTGTPARAWAMGSLLYFSPIPDAAYVISFVYYKRPAEITQTSGDIDDIPSRYHELLRRMTFMRLQESGYTSDRELTINDAVIRRSMGQAIKDDIATYGGPTMSLYDDSYTMKIG
jgi:hypothetical protein